jgi:hypothetical protein
MSEYDETTQEAAERLKLTVGRIRQLCLSGELDAKKEGSERRGEWKIRRGAEPKNQRSRDV